MPHILVIDDSALMRRRLGQILAEAGHEVTLARNGAHALDLLEEVEPDVITMDINMPQMDGLTCLAHVMEIRPTPVIMVSSLTTKGATATFEALELGAVDYVAKPDGTVSLSIDRVADMLCEKVEAAAKARLRRGRKVEAPPPRAARPLKRAPRILLMGASTGGPRTVEQVLSALPGNFPLPILLCQHMPAAFTETFARRLAANIALKVVEVTTPTPLKPGQVHLGRGDADMVLAQRSGQLAAVPMPQDQARPWHPSVGRMVASSVKLIPPEETIGVLLTGMGDDGAAELADLHRAGGTTIAEAEETCVVWGMPRALAERGGASQVLPADAIAPQLMAWAMGQMARRAG